MNLEVRNIKDKKKGEVQMMVSKNITIKIPTGLEARPVALLVQVASQYESSIYLEIEEKKVNAKSIMGMMTLGIVEGEQVTVIANGPDEDEAIKNMEKYMTVLDEE